MKLRNQSCQLILGHYKLSYRTIFFVLGENFYDHRRKFLLSPKQILRGIERGESVDIMC